MTKTLRLWLLNLDLTVDHGQLRRLGLERFPTLRFVVVAGRDDFVAQRSARVARRDNPNRGPEMVERRTLRGGGWRSNLALSFCPSGSSTTTLLRPLSPSDWPAASSTRIRQTTFSSRLNWLLSTQNGPGAPGCAPRTRSPSTNNCLRATPWAPAASTSPTMAAKSTTTGNAFMKAPPAATRLAGFRGRS